MKLKKVLVAWLALLPFSISYADNQATNVEPILPTAGWQQLFNGHDLDKWGFVGLGDFAIKDNALMSRGKMGVMWYKPEKFGNCVVRVVFKVSHPETSAAVFVLMPNAPTDVWDAVNHGYQIKIADHTDGYHRTGSVYSLSSARDGLTKPAGEWNTMDIFLEDQAITVYINGQFATHYTPTQSVPPKQASSEPDRGNPMAATGYIGVQNHNDLINEMVGQVWFKEISVLPLQSDTQSTS
ncbi:MAG: DUF1080 domain-containing protein [Gammaproteobacteria bacterium]|nr:DUF1080 domain-containing protein [Gammaproteobacteria bacterium]